MQHRFCNFALDLSHECSPERRDYANGYKPKTLLTRLGEITFAVPQTREAGFYPNALEKGSRTEQALNLTLAEMYVQGVSTRKVIEILQRAGLKAARHLQCARTRRSRTAAQGCDRAMARGRTEARRLGRGQPARGLCRV